MDRTKVVACLMAAALLAGCSRQRPITVGSKNFTEQVLLGEITAQHLENKLRTRVVRQLNLGGTLLTHQALISGQIDVYPEYTGTALTVILKLPPDSDPAVVQERVRREYESRFHLAWMPPLGFNNGFAMVIRGADARANRLRTLSDAAQYKPGWQLGVGYEFLERPDGYAALMKTYNLQLKGAPRSMDLGLLYQALRQEQVNMAAGNDTDGMLSVMDVKVLQDDKHAFPPYQAALATRPDSFSAHPGMRDALNDLSGKFSEELMRKLNYEVDGLHHPVSEVAKAALRDVGLL